MGQLLTFWSFSVLDRDHRLAGLHCPRSEALFVVFRTHRYEPAAGDVEDEISFKGKGRQGILGQIVHWMRRVEEMQDDRSCMRRRVRARQQDLTIECDGLVRNDESKLVNNFLDVARRLARDVHTKGLVVFSQVTRSISTVGAARNLRSCGCNS
jgi:hypothetical protein